MPVLDAFDTAEHFYGTLAHEHVHWTGAKSRKARDLSGRFGSNAYAVEELIAELGAAFVGAQLGIGTVTRDDHARYLNNWISVLRESPRALVTVASQAQQAVDLLNELAGAVSQGVAA
jgi:antirestriction protein ArdC